MTRRRENRVMRALREQLQPAFTVACEVGLSAAHVVDAIADEAQRLRERLRDL